MNPTIEIPKGPWDRQKPTALGGELPSHGGQSRILEGTQTVLYGMGRYYSESVVDSGATMDLLIDMDRFEVSIGKRRKKAKINAATAMFAGQTLAWTRTLLEQLTQTEMEVTAAKFRISLRELKLK